MKFEKPENPPCGATHLARLKNGSWTWLFYKPEESEDYDHVENIEE